MPRSGRPWRQIVITVLFVGALASPAQAAPSEETAVIVVLRDDYRSGAVVQEHRSRYGASVSHVYGAAINGYAARVPASRLGALRADPRVLLVSEDGEVHAIGGLGGVTAAHVPPTQGVNRIDGELSTRHAVDNKTTLGFAVAVIDTGSGPHSLLNVVGGKNCSDGTSFNDGNGHGTHVAGTIAAKSGTQQLGLLPGAPILSIRVLDNTGSGTFSGVICGIDWVTANAAGTTETSGLPIKVANMSLGGTGSDGTCASTALHLAICNSEARGVTYVVAAGNSNQRFENFVPATFAQVLTVTAMADFNGAPGGGAAATCRPDGDDTNADFSNFARTTEDKDHTIAGPGVCITSLWLGDGFLTISGTSMASPHVAGVAALCIAAAKCVGTPAAIRAKLRADAQAKDVASGNTYGFFRDPDSSPSRNFYGYLTWAGGY